MEDTVIMVFYRSAVDVWRATERKEQNKISRSHVSAVNKEKMINLGSLILSTYI